MMSNSSSLNPHSKPFAPRTTTMTSFSTSPSSGHALADLLGPSGGGGDFGIVGLGLRPPGGSSTPIAAGNENGGGVYDFGSFKGALLSASSSSSVGSSSGVSSASSSTSSSSLELSLLSSSLSTAGSTNSLHWNAKTSPTSACSSSSLASANKESRSLQRSTIGILEHPPTSKDDFGLRGLARALNHSSFQGELSSALTMEDLGFPDVVAKQQSLPLHDNMDSVFAKYMSTPMSSWEVPEEYYHSWILADRLGADQRWSTELLFFLFYTATGDALQLLAGSELYDRGWRYNKISGLWIGRYPHLPPEIRTDTYEKGAYQYFDVRSWKRKPASFELHYEELSEKIPAPKGIKELYQWLLSNAANNAKIRRKVLMMQLAPKRTAF